MGVVLMRLMIVWCGVFCVMAASVTAQEAGARGAVGEKGTSGVLETGLRVASGIALQPNATGQRQRRGSRMATGLGLIVAGGVLIGLKDLWVEDVGDHADSVNQAVILGGLGLVGLGGVVIAMADTTTPGISGADGVNGIGALVSGRRGLRVAKRLAW